MRLKNLLKKIHRPDDCYTRIGKRIIFFCTLFEFIINYNSFSRHELRNNPN